MYLPLFGGCKLSKKKVISVQLETHKALLERGKKSETFDDVITSLIASEKTLETKIIELETENLRLNEWMAQETMSKED